MAETLLLKAQKREKTGSKVAARVRQAGRIPAVVYGHKEKPIAISLDGHNLAKAIHHRHRLMDVQIGRKRQKMVLKDIQYDYLGRNIIHVDLMRVDVTERIEVTVTIELKGKAKGVGEGAIVEEHADSLDIECGVTEIPQSIAVSIRELGVGDSLHAGDVELPEGVKLVSDPETLLVTCRMVTVAPEAEEAAQVQAETPEIIGKGKQAEPEAEESSGQENA